MEIVNPFLIYNYVSKKYFCNRDKEVARLKSAMKNGRNVRLVSMRRLGKSSLIQHFFKNQRSFNTIYVDIYRVKSHRELELKLAESVFNQLGKPNSGLFKKVSGLFQSLELNFSFDQITGNPQIGVAPRAGKPKGNTLKEIFKYLESQKRPVVIAIDEFQQVSTFEDAPSEAVLREHIQRLHNVRFIFAGSDQGMMRAIFSDYNRPFYQSTEPLYLNPIPSEEYSQFIKHHFEAAGKKINDEAVQMGLEWTRNQTYNVQLLFNRLFDGGHEVNSVVHVTNTCDSLLKEHEMEFAAYMRLLSTNQAALLQAIAKEGVAVQPTAGAFLIKYNLTAHSTVRLSLQSLLDKEMIYQDEEGYRVTDVLMSRWLASDV